MKIQKKLEVTTNYSRVLSRKISNYFLSQNKYFPLEYLQVVCVLGRESMMSIKDIDIAEKHKIKIIFHQMQHIWILLILK